MKTRIGFGCYRVQHSQPLHELAMLDAVAGGVDLIDTSANYGNGSSELLVGRVLQKLDVGQTRPLVCTKLGYLQGDALDLARTRELMGSGYSDVVKLDDSLWHCIHPAFLEEALEGSLNRLGSPSVDILLLHNPEYFLQSHPATSTDLVQVRTQFQDRITLAFEWCETAVARGLIGSYGISSNTFAHSADVFDAVSLDTCISVAEQVAGAGHRFSTVQLPFNLVEHFAATTLCCDNESKTFIERAKQAGLRVLVNRPLNAIVDGEVIRLVSHPQPQHLVHPDDVSQRIHALEIVEHDLANALLARGSWTERDEAVISESFRVAGALCQSWSKFNNLPHWREVRTSYLDPRLLAARTFVDLAPLISGLGSYIDDLESVLEDIDVVYRADENAALDELRSSMAEVFAMDPDTPLQQIAIQAVRCTEGVECVLVGMRRPEYVADVLIVLDLPELNYDRNVWIEVAKILAQLSE